MRGLLRRARQRLADRPDSEHEQALTRLVVVPVMLAYMLWAPFPPDQRAHILAVSGAVFAAGFVATLGIIAHILWRPDVNPARRAVGIVVDVAGIGSAMLLGGRPASVFFPILLWVILGHGFRYGRPYLFGAAGLSLAAFAGVLVLSPDWRAMPFIGVGLLLSLVLLPAYFAVLLSKLNRAIRHAEEANRAKSHFLAAVSHEFRTPLNAVIGMSDLLRTTRLEPDQDDMVATVRAAAGGLLGLVNNVLDLAKLEARRFTIDDGPLDLHQVVASVRHLLLHGAASKGLYLRVRLGADVPYRLRGDARAVQQILLNLVGNATKFTERGGITVEVQAVERGPGTVRVRFEVRDTGIGLSPAAQAEIFERFAQAEETRRRVIGGTGLGLSIARELVGLMGGELGVISAQGLGSRFWFELPLPLADGADGFAEPARGQVVVLGGRASATAAVARLDALGFRGRAVASVEAALELAQQGRQVRVVLVTGRDPPVDVARLVAELQRRPGADPVDVLTLGGEQGELPDLTLADLPETVDDASLLSCLRAALQTPAGAGPADRAVAPEPPVRPLSILVAEDNRTNQKVITRLLEHAGHKVRVVGDGQGAVDAIDAERFDAVLMDINMPDMDGIETVKLLRFMRKPAELPPIVALSADATPETQAACREIGFSAYLLKPIDTRVLTRTLADLTGDGPEPAALAATAAVEPTPAEPDPPSRPPSTRSSSRTWPSSTPGTASSPRSSTTSSRTPPA